MKNVENRLDYRFIIHILNEHRIIFKETALLFLFIYLVSSVNGFSFYRKSSSITKKSYLQNPFTEMI